MNERQTLQIDDTLYETEVPDKTHGENGRRIQNPYEVRAIIPGTVIEICVQAGKMVSAGQVILILEAMKMYIEIEAEVEGRVTEIPVSAGDTVDKEQLLAKIEG
jgi:biotin carboxyl carrier protein